MSPLLSPVHQWFSPTLFMWKWSLSNQSFVPWFPSTCGIWAPANQKNKPTSGQTCKATISARADVAMHANIWARARAQASKAVLLGERRHSPFCCNWKTFLVVGIESQIIFGDLSRIYYFLAVDAWPTYERRLKLLTATTVRRSAAVCVCVTCRVMFSLLWKGRTSTCMPPPFLCAPWEVCGSCKASPGTNTRAHVRNTHTTHAKISTKYHHQNFLAFLRPHFYFIFIKCYDKVGGTEEKFRVMFLCFRTLVELEDQYVLWHVKHH